MPPQTGKLFLDSLKGAVEKRNCQALETLIKPSSLQVREQETNCLGMGNQSEASVSRGDAQPFLELRPFLKAFQVWHLRPKITPDFQKTMFNLYSAKKKKTNKQT